MLLLQGKSVLSKAVMLKKLREAVADIEQMKADLVDNGTGRPAKHPCLPGAATQKKKRKAPNMAPWHPLVGRHALPKRQMDEAPAEDGNACFDLTQLHAACVYYTQAKFGDKPQASLPWKGCFTDVAYTTVM